MARRHFGSVRRRSSGRWQALYWHEGKLRSAGTFAMKADALAHLSDVEAAVRRGVWMDPKESRVLVRDYAQRWLAGRPDLALRTHELYSYLMEKYILPELGSHSLATLSPSTVRAWHAQLAHAHPSTAAKAYRLLSTMMKTAVTDGVIAVSPCRVVGAGTEHAAERPVASLDDVRRLWDAMPPRLRIVVSLATWCQLRRGEILGLRRCDVDVANGQLHIEQSRTFLRDGSSVIKGPKTRAGRRVIAVPSGLLDELEGHLESYVGPAPDDLVVTTSTGAPASPVVLQRAWSRARRFVGREDLHLHDLRHTGLTWAAATGATTAELMHRAGHASPDAAQRYQHATRERDQLIADALDGLVIRSRRGAP